jgi:hypothetical protein
MNSLRQHTFQQSIQIFAFSLGEFVLFLLFPILINSLHHGEVRLGQAQRNHWHSCKKMPTEKEIERQIFVRNLAFDVTEAVRKDFFHFRIP